MHSVDSGERAGGMISEGQLHTIYIQSHLKSYSSQHLYIQFSRLQQRPWDWCGEQQDTKTALFNDWFFVGGGSSCTKLGDTRDLEWQDDTPRT